MKRSKKDFYIDWGIFFGLVVLVLVAIDRGFI